MFSFKSASVADVGVIRDLASRIWGNTYGSILTDEQIEYMFEMMYSEESLHQQMTESGHLFFLVEMDGTPCGYLSIEPKENNHFIFQKVYTLPSVQGKGVGRYLMEQGIAYLKQNYASPLTIELFVNRKIRLLDFINTLVLRSVRRAITDRNGYYMNIISWSCRYDKNKRG
jgi:GNAT superfamily N-acetyltransferase